MNKKLMIDRLFKIIPLYETVDLNNFEKYLTRTIIDFSGYDSELMDEVVTSLKGLKKNIDELDHSTVKTVVFNLISIVKRNL